MFIKRLVLCTALLSLGLLLATSAQAKKFSLTGGGGQTHIGNGLPLPVQPSATPLVTGTNFPPLLVPPVPGAVVSGTTVKPLLTAMATPAGPVTKSGYQRQLSVPAGVLSKAASQKVVGLKFSNPTLWAVGTNLNFNWPAAPAVFSTGAAVTTTVVAGLGGTMTYSNTLGARFGGPAQFVISPGPAAGIIPGAPVTIYLVINATTPACTHPAFGGTDGNCLAGLMQALPNGNAAIGGATSVTVTTVGGPVLPNNVAAVKLGLTPLGTVLAAFPAAANPGIPTNMATSQAGPWTTGKIVISQPLAGGLFEKFTLSGKDSRTVGGRGTIQLVAGSLSARQTSGPNANRGWIQLELGGAFQDAVPAMSPALLAAAGGLILLAGGYVARQRLTS